MSTYYEIIVFTASSAAYANTICNFLDPKGFCISHILSRENCYRTKNGFFIKDLRILRNRPLSSILIVDNLSHSYGYQISNGVPILSWKSSKQDNELKNLVDLLIEASFAEDVREWTKSKLRLEELSGLCEEKLF